MNFNDSYPEINNIQNFITSNKVYINKTNSEQIDNKLKPLHLRIGKSTHIVHVDDEYEDLRYNNNLLNFVLVFRELELINETTDFLDWCKQQALNATNDKLLNYYKDTVKLLPGINDYFPNKKLTSFISDLDFQLNAGAIQCLRK